MPIGSFFPDRCTTERDEPTVDENNQPVAVWSDWVTDEPCRLVIREQKNPVGDLAQNPYVRTTKLLLGAYVDVKKGDRIREVVLEDGEVVGPFRIESFLQRRARSAQHHVTLMLEDL